jgi:hypothetical protein
MLGVVGRPHQPVATTNPGERLGARRAVVGARAHRPSARRPVAADVLDARVERVRATRPNCSA